MSSIGHFVCLLCFMAVRGEQPQTKHEAPQPTTSLRVKESQPSTPVSAVASPQPTSSTVPALQKAKEKLEEAIKEAKPSVSTSLKKLANNKSAERASINGSVHENKSSAKLKLCADKVIAKGTLDMEASLGTFYKTEIKPTKNHSGRAIYKNSEGNYMYFWAPAGNWIIEGEGHYDSSFAVIFVHSNTTCPEDAWGNPWAAWDEVAGGWSDKYGITVTVDTASTEEGNARKEDENQEKDEDLLANVDQEDQVAVFHIENKAVVNEPSNASLMNLPLLAALLSFVSVLAYSLRFLCKIFKRRQSSSQKWKSTSRSNEEAGAQELEDALDGAMPKMSSASEADALPVVRRPVVPKMSSASEADALPVVRRQVQANDEKESCANGWDKDSESDAGWGEDAWDKDGWDDLESMAT